MLKISLPPNDKPKLFSWPQVPYTPTKTATAEVVEESRKWAGLAAARQAIIQKLVDECPFKVGQEVKCHSLQAQAKHGKDVVINKIVTSYAQIKNDTWPKNDQPMIIHAYSRDKDTHFICTSGYLIAKKEKDEE